MNIKKTCPCGSKMIIKFIGHRYYQCMKCGKKYNIRYTEDDTAYFESVED